MKIKLIGTSTETVTGSCTLITTKDKKNFLIECGGTQTSNILKDYVTNASDFPFKLNTIDYVVIGDKHIDHTLRLGYLFKYGYSGKVIVPVGNRAILKLMLINSSQILDKNYEYLSKKNKVRLPYDESDVEKVIDSTIEVDFNIKYELYKGVTMEYYHSGHTLNSAQVLINDNNKKLLYTSDLGNVSQPNIFTRELQRVKNANIVISESTYAERSRNNLITREEDISILDNIINNNKGNIIIPLFALQRLQVIMKVLYDMKPNCKIVIDTPLGSDITKAFEDILNDKDYSKMIEDKMFHFTHDWIESQMYINEVSPKIVLTCGGFCEAGRIINWLQAHLGNSNNTICFVGYSGENGIANSIRSGSPSCNIYGIEVQNRCKVEVLNSFSSHMQRDDLLEYLSSINCQKILLHHGNQKGKLDLKEDLELLLSQKCKTTKVIIPNRGEEIIL